MKERKEKIAKLARETTLNYGDFLASKERTLKTYNTVKNYRVLFLDGYRKGLQNAPLENFTDLVEENGKMVQRKNHRSFLGGYKKGLEEGQKQVKVNNKTR